jgi:hypothetical protein
MFHQSDDHIFGVVSWIDAIPLHGGFHALWWMLKYSKVVNKRKKEVDEREKDFS